VILSFLGVVSQLKQCQRRTYNRSVALRCCCVAVDVAVDVLHCTVLYWTVTIYGFGFAAVLYNVRTLRVVLSCVVLLFCVVFALFLLESSQGKSSLFVVMDCLRLLTFTVLYCRMN
jgi:uncharacterized membrane protein